jgi:hypothetical protein
MEEKNQNEKKQGWNWPLIVGFLMLFSLVIVFGVNMEVRNSSKPKESIEDSLKEDSIYDAIMKKSNAEVEETSGSETKTKTLEDEDEEGNGILYCGNYRYQQVETVKIHGKAYDVAIDETEGEIMWHLPEPDHVYTSRVNGMVCKNLTWDNNSVMIVLVDNKVYNIMKTR